MSTSKPEWPSVSHVDVYLNEADSIPVVTELLDYCPSQDKKPANHTIVIVPGNPGVITAYRQFATSLYEQFDQRVRLLVVSMAGHSETDLNQGRLFSLEDQIQHKISFLSDFRRVNPDQQWVLMGHSVGAFINSQVFVRRPDLAPHFVFHLFPTVFHLRLSNAVSLLTIPFVRGLLCPLIAHGVPQFIKSRLLAHLSDNVKNIGKFASNSNFLANVLFFARTEVHGIKELEANQISALRSHAAHSTWLFCPHDPYVPPELHGELERTFGDTADMLMMGQHVKHAFVLENSVEVAQVVFEKLVTHDQVGPAFRALVPIHSKDE